jgi:hypothetical protein
MPPPATPQRVAGGRVDGDSENDNPWSLTGLSPKHQTCSIRLRTGRLPSTSSRNASGSERNRPLISHHPVGGRCARQIVFHAVGFDASPEQNASLRASWSILDAGGNTLTHRTVALRTTVAATDNDALAAARLRLMQRLARIVAKMFQKL